MAHLTMSAVAGSPIQDLPEQADAVLAQRDLAVAVQR